MIYIILLFSLINTIKSITLSEYYNNFLILSIFPFEIALLSFNNTFTDSDGSANLYMAGYGNTTSAIDAIQFSMSSGNIDSGTIDMYGVL